MLNPYRRALISECFFRSLIFGPNLHSAHINSPRLPLLPSPRSARLLPISPPNCPTRLDRHLGQFDARLKASDRKGIGNQLARLGLELLAGRKWTCPKRGASTVTRTFLPSRSSSTATRSLSFMPEYSPRESANTPSKMRILCPGRKLGRYHAACVVQVYFNARAVK